MHVTSETVFQVFALAGNASKIFYSVEWKNQQQKEVESTVKWDVLCCHCENSSKGLWLQIIVDSEFAKKQATGVSILIDTVKFKADILSYHSDSTKHNVYYWNK